MVVIARLIVFRTLKSRGGKNYASSPGKFHGDNAFRMDLYRLAPEFQFRVYTAVEYEIFAVGVERGYRWMVRHLLANYPEIIIPTLPGKQLSPLWRTVSEVTRFDHCFMH